MASPWFVLGCALLITAIVFVPSARHEEMRVAPRQTADIPEPVTRCLGHAHRDLEECFLAWNDRDQSIAVFIDAITVGIDGSLLSSRVSALYDVEGASGLERCVTEAFQRVNCEPPLLEVDLEVIVTWASELAVRARLVAVREHHLTEKQRRLIIELRYRLRVLELQMREMRYRRDSFGRQYDVLE